MRIKYWLSHKDIRNMSSIFGLPAARVRVPGGSPSVSYNNAKRTNSMFVKSNKNIHNHWPEQRNELIKQIQKRQEFFAEECVRDERFIPESRHQWCTKKENRRREAIGFEIPVTRGAFHSKEKEAPITNNHNTQNNIGRNICETRVAEGFPKVSINLLCR